MADTQLRQRVSQGSVSGSGGIAVDTVDVTDEEAVDESDKPPRPGSMAISADAAEVRPVLKKERRSVAVAASGDEEDEDERVFVYGGWDSDRLGDNNSVSK